MPYNLFISHSWTYGDSYDRLIEMLDDAPNFYYKGNTAQKKVPYTAKCDIINLWINR